MILLRPDCLVFRTPTGESIPCSVEEVSIDLVGEADWLDKELVRNAALGVLHYFREELGRTSVTVAEFAQALERALITLGVKVKPNPSTEPTQETSTIAKTDLLSLAFECGKSFELAFFSSLREALRRNLELAPQVLCFHGLRICVKHLTGARRWSGRCQRLNDQIVDYLRTCLSAEERTEGCALVVS